MRSQLVVPNLHVLLVHYPIALLFVGVAIELFSFLGWRRSSFRVAGRWMIFLGALSAVPAALSGAQAMCDLARAGVEPMATWKEVLATSPLVANHAAWASVVRHTWLQAISTGVLLVLVTLWLACSDRWRASLHPLFLLVLLGTCGAIGLGAWHAGEAIYRHGVSVDTTDDHISPVANAATLPTTSLSSTTIAAQPETVSDFRRDWQAKIEYVAPPLQVHVVLAGFMISMAAAALGLAMRTAFAGPPKIGGVHDIAAALGTADPDEAYLSFDERRAMIQNTTRAAYPTARFWLLATLLAIFTAACGIWLLAGDSDIWNPNSLTQLVFNPDQTPNHWTLNRRAAHVIVGGTIVLATLLLALAARFAPRRPMLLGCLAAILLGALTAQVWVGLLLMFDANPTSTEMRWTQAGR